MHTTKTTHSSKSPTRRYGLQYAERGLSVFPVRPNGKAPLGKLVPNGVKEATTDKQKIRDWWRSVPSANVAIATGEVFAIDLDVGDDKNGIIAWNEEVIEGDVPKTTVVRTPSGGMHLYFRIPEEAPDDMEIKNSTSELANGVDVRGHGGYIVAPPSTREDGAYTFESEDTGIANAPGWLLSQVKKSRSESSTTARGSDFDAPDTIPNGQRNSKLASFAGYLRQKGLTEEEMLPTIKTLNQSRCKPPLEIGEVEDIAGSISEYEPGDPEIKPIRPSGDGHAGDAPRISTDGNQGGGDEGGAPNVQPLLGTEEPPPMKWRVNDFVPEDHLTTLIGDGGTGKSILALHLSLRIATGRPFLGMGTRQGRVLYVDHELDRDEQLRRVHKIGRGMGLDASDPSLSDRFLYWRPKYPLGSREHQERLLGTVDEHSIDLVVLDSLTMGAQGDVTDVADVVPIMQDVRQWPTTVAIDHVSHSTANGSAAQARAFGSVFKRNAARSSLTLAQADTGGYCIQQEKSNFSEGDGRLVYAVDWGEDEIVFDSISDADERAAGLLSDLSSTDVTAVAVEEMWDASQQPVMPSDVVTWRQENVEDNKVQTEKAVRNHFSALKRRGEIVTDEHGGAMPAKAKHEPPSDTSDEDSEAPF